MRKKQGVALPALFGGAWSQFGRWPPPHDKYKRRGEGGVFVLCRERATRTDLSFLTTQPVKFYLFRARRAFVQSFTG